jgi:hypothetical protein
MSLRQEVIDRFGEEILSKPYGSAIAQNLHGVTGENAFQSLLHQAWMKLVEVGEKDPNYLSCVEIGTCNGISTMLLARFCQTVRTFDIAMNPRRMEVWSHFKVSDRIESFVSPDIHLIRKTIQSKRFDLAYIDGGHLYGEVMFDIETVEHCGNIIFHDYDTYSADNVMRAVHELLCRRGGRFFAIPPFAYWEATE